MRPSKTLAKLRAGKPVRMCSLGHFNPAYVKHAAQNKFDCIWFDLEHRAMSEREVQAMLAFFHLFDIDCMLRAPTLEKTRLYRYFEDGAAGLMIPHVSTPERARELVQAVKFPPIGDRGLDGAGLDSDFYVRGDEGYPERANRETFLVVQIETPQAVQNAEEIAAVEGVDVLFIGPADLSLRIKHAPQNCLTMEQSIQRVAAAAKKHGKAWGQPGFSPEHIGQLWEQGAQLVSHGGDFGAFMKMLENNSRELDELLGE